MVIDHHFRRVMGIHTFRDNPTSVSISHFLAGAIHAAGTTPKYIISDKGKQFWCDTSKEWCVSHSIKPRFGAVGQHGSIALIEQFILSIKNECTRNIPVPPCKHSFDAALKGQQTSTEIAQEFGVRPTQVKAWKKQLLTRSSDVFG